MTMNRHLAQLVGHLDALRIRHHLHDCGLRCHAHVALENLRSIVLFGILGEMDAFLVKTLIPIPVPKGRRADVGEFLHHVNSRLGHGCFRMDPSDGDLAFQVTTLIEPESGVSISLLSRALEAATGTVDVLFPVLAKVVFAHMPPTQAIEQGEAAMAEMLGRGDNDEESA